MKQTNIVYYLFSVLVAIDLVENILQPTSKSTLVKYHLSVAQARAIDFSVMLPFILIYFLALVGYVNLYRYANQIKDYKDGRAFRTVSHGLMAFAFGLPVVGIINTAIKWIAFYHKGFVPSSIIMTNYFTLIIAVIAFFLISQGVYKLTVQTKLHLKLAYIWLLALVLVFIGTSYTYLTFRQANSVFLGAPPNPRIFYLPAWLILTTIIVPYVAMWSLGLLSVIQMAIYNLHVKGMIYRKALIRLTIGIGIVLLSYVVLEYLITLTTSILKIANIGWILAIVYGFEILLGVGYWFVASGSRRIKRIEDV